MTVLVAGDDMVLAVALKKDGAAFAIAAGATVKAALISQDRKRLLCGPVTCSNDAFGADWPNSLVMVLFPSAATSAITEFKPALLEIEVHDGGKLTWFADVKIVNGKIT